MKEKPKKLHELQDEYRERVVGLCCVCSKPCSGWYGAWEEGGTCSKKCELVREAKPKYPDNPEKEDYPESDFGY